MASSLVHTVLWLTYSASPTGTFCFLMCIAFMGTEQSFLPLKFSPGLTLLSFDDQTGSGIFFDGLAVAWTVISVLSYEKALMRTFLNELVMLRFWMPAVPDCWS